MDTFYAPVALYFRFPDQNEFQSSNSLELVYKVSLLKRFIDGLWTVLSGQ